MSGFNGTKPGLRDIIFSSRHRPPAVPCSGAVMNRRAFAGLLACASFYSFAPSLLAQEIDAPQFSRHIAAVFSKHGCNSGGCHGAVKGQNGFRLTLFGADPTLDHESLRRAVAGRRLNFVAPD